MYLIFFFCNSFFLPVWICTHREKRYSTVCHHHRCVPISASCCTHTQYIYIQSPKVAAMVVYIYSVARHFCLMLLLWKLCAWNKRPEASSPPFYFYFLPPVYIYIVGGRLRGGHSQGYERATFSLYYILCPTCVSIIACVVHFWTISPKQVFFVISKIICFHYMFVDNLRNLFILIYIRMRALTFY